MDMICSRIEDYYECNKCCYKTTDVTSDVDALERCSMSCSSLSLGNTTPVTSSVPVPPVASGMMYTQSDLDLAVSKAISQQMPTNATAAVSEPMESTETPAEPSQVVEPS